MGDLCVVVGAGPQLGTAMARCFGRRGHRVALLARGEGRLAATCRSLAEAGIDAHWRSADAATAEALGTTITEMAAELGPVDVLVYNAATQHGGCGAATVALDEMRRAVAINLISPIAAIQAVLPGMRHRRRGTILFTGGTFGLEPSPDHVQLGTGKAALRNLALGLAKEAAPWGIHVATVTIGAVVAVGTDHDPDAVAERYWDLHAQGKPWEREVGI